MCYGNGEITSYACSIRVIPSEIYSQNSRVLCNGHYSIRIHTRVRFTPAIRCVEMFIFSLQKGALVKVLKNRSCSQNSLTTPLARQSKSNPNVSPSRLCFHTIIPFRLCMHLPLASSLCRRPPLLRDANLTLSLTDGTYHTRARLQLNTTTRSQPGHPAATHRLLGRIRRAPDRLAMVSMVSNTAHNQCFRIRRSLQSLVARA